MSLSRQSIALVLATKNNQTQHYIHQKHKRETEKTALANKTIYTLIWYTPFTTSSQETEWALFLQPLSPHGATAHGMLVVKL